MNKFIQPGLAIIVGGTLAFLTTGCTTTTTNAQTRACQPCKRIDVVQLPKAHSGDEGDLFVENADLNLTEYSCPGCQDAITALFENGKSVYECSICQQEAFTCPASQP